MDKCMMDSIGNNVFYSHYRKAHAEGQRMIVPHCAIANKKRGLFGEAFMDRRQKKTRAAIFAAFNELLTEKSYHQITVQDIIDRANVGRTTFYDHFETKDELLKEMCATLFDHVFSDMLSAESTHDFSLSDGSSREVITHMIYHLRDNRRNILGILACESGEMFLQFFRQYLKDVFSSCLPVQGRQDLPEDFLLNHVSGSFVNMVEWWIKRGLKETPEQLAAYFDAVTQPVLEWMERDGGNA